MQALVTGPFHASVSNGHACAWIGRQRSPSAYFVWPDGWAVELNPTRLLDPAGQVVAREGQTPYMGGGLMFDRLTTPCGSIEKGWAVGTVSTHR